jgi:hypothetical protein
VQILGAGPNWYLGVNCSIGISNTMAHVCLVPDFVRVIPREFNFYYKKTSSHQIINPNPEVPNSKKKLEHLK